MAPSPRQKNDYTWYAWHISIKYETQHRRRLQNLMTLSCNSKRSGLFSLPSTSLYCVLNSIFLFKNSRDQSYICIKKVLSVYWFVFLPQNKYQERSLRFLSRLKISQNSRYLFQYFSPSHLSPNKQLTDTKYGKKKRLLKKVGWRISLH